MMCQQLGTAAITLLLLVLPIACIRKFTTPSPTTNPFSRWKTWETMSNGQLQFSSWKKSIACLRIFWLRWLAQSDAAYNSSCRMDSASPLRMQHGAHSKMILAGIVASCNYKFIMYCCDLILFLSTVFWGPFWSGCWPFLWHNLWVTTHNNRITCQCIICIWFLSSESETGWQNTFQIFKSSVPLLVLIYGVQQFNVYFDRYAPRIWRKFLFSCQIRHQ